MTLPSTNLSMSDVATEIGISSTGINLNQQNVRRLSGDISGPSTMGDLRGKTWTLNLTGTQSAGRCYSAQSGFSIDRYGTAGDIILTMGTWPSDPPNCQTCSWTWLKFGASENSTRKSNNSRPFWNYTWTLNLSTLGVGNGYYTQCPYWPYTIVGYTYYVYRNSVNSVQITIYPGAWGTGDTGTTISVQNWYDGFINDFGGSTLTLTWTSLGY